MATQCWSTVRGCKMRVTKIDECGKPVEGLCSQVVTDGFVTVSYSAEIEEGDELLLKNACGDICVVDRGCPELKYYNVEIEFCQVDPDLYGILTGQPNVYDYKGDAVGIRVGQKVPCNEGFALEVWTTIPQKKCEPGQTNQSFGYFLVPWLTNGIMGDFTIENDVITFSVTAQSRANHQWNKGPYNVVAQNSAQTPGRLLTALDQTEHLHMQLTTTAPPASQCGCQPLEYCTEPAVAIAVTNDSNDTGVVFSDNEVATAPGTATTVRVVVTNTGAVPGVVQTLTLTDENGLSYDMLTGTGTMAASGTCPVPPELAAGAQFTCDVIVTGYSPVSGVTTTITGAVVLASLVDEFCIDQASDTTNITTSATQPPIDSMSFTLRTETGASATATGPGGTVNAGLLNIQCAAPDELDTSFTIRFNVNDLEDITINSATLTATGGRSWNLMTGANTGSVPSEGPITGIDCLANTTHLVDATCVDDLEFSQTHVDAMQAFMEGATNPSVTYTVIINATSNSSGTTQVTTRNIDVNCG